MHYLIFFIFSTLCTLLIEYKEYVKRNNYSNVVNAHVHEIDKVAGTDLKNYGLKGSVDMYIATFIIQDESGKDIYVKAKKCAYKYPFREGDVIQLKTKEDDISDIMVPEYEYISIISRALIYIIDVIFLVLMILVVL